VPGPEGHPRLFGTHFSQTPEKRVGMSADTAA